MNCVWKYNIQYIPSDKQSMLLENTNFNLDSGGTAARNAVSVKKMYGSSPEHCW